MNGSIKRGKRPEDNFTIVSNDIINDLVISAEARLLLIYMISKPDGWVFRPVDLKRQLGTTDSPAGKTKYDRVMQELRDNGYLEYVTLQDDNGKIIGKQWIISQNIPNRLSQKPTVGLSDSRKTKPLSNTEVVSKTEKDIAEASAPVEKQKSERNHYYDAIKAELDKRKINYTPALIGKLIKALKAQQADYWHIVDYFMWLDAYKRGLVIDGKLWSWTARNMSAYVTDWLDSRTDAQTDDKFGFNNPLWTTL